MADFFSDINIWMVMAVPASLLAIMLHEIAHGLMALVLGDSTAKDRKRLSFNPIRHIDPVGLLLLIIVGFGWAKPVPVDSSHFKKPRRDLALVSLAGPLSNFLLTLLCVFAIRLTLLFSGAAAEWSFAFFTYTAIRSAGLGIFNLIPIPPLDGSKILYAFLPWKIVRAVQPYERFGMFLLLGLSFLPRLLSNAGIFIQNPVIYPINGTVSLAFSIAGLREPLESLLVAVRQYMEDSSYNLIDIVLGFEPGYIFAYLQNAFATAAAMVGGIPA